MSAPTPPRPLPQPTVDTAPFWEACAAGELRLQRCDACGHLRFPPSPLCPRCWSRTATWTACSGRARLRSHVVFHQLYHPAFAAALPYAVGLCELEEGPSLYAPVSGAAPRSGDALRLAFEPVADGVALPLFVTPED